MTVLSMEQKRAPSASALLSKQLENISDTLSKASQRRDTELQRRGSKSTITLRKLNHLSPADLAAVSFEQRFFEPLKKDMAPVKAKGLSASVYAASPAKNTDQPKVSPLETHKSSDDDEPRTPPKSSHQTLPLDTTAYWHSDRENTDARDLLAQLGSGSAENQGGTDTHSEGYDDPSRLLAELERLKVSNAHLTSKYKGQCNSDSEDDAIDPVELRCRLENLLARSKEGETSSNMRQFVDDHIKDVQSVETSDLTAPLASPDNKILPYVVAATLEDQGSRWEWVKFWTTYLFSNGSEDYGTRPLDEAAVLQAAKTLNEIIKKTMDEMSRRRLIVRNIAAGAEEQDLQKVFSKFGVHDHDVHFMPGRDPVRNTRTAYINMVDRKSAIAATYTRSNIFGLLLDIRIAAAKTVQ